MATTARNAMATTCPHGTPDSQSISERFRLAWSHAINLTIGWFMNGKNCLHNCHGRLDSLSGGVNLAAAAPGADRRAPGRSPAC